MAMLSRHFVPRQLPQAALVVVALAAITSAVLADDLDPARFESRIRPLLVKSCFTCHGDGKTSGGLRVDTRASLLKGGDTGPAIVPGEPERSLLLQAIRRADDVSAMPPDSTLAPADVEAVAEWIRQGAPWPEASAPFELTRHWAFEPLSDPAPPEVRDQAWGQSSIDAFIRAKQEVAGVHPAAPADRRTLIRRATFDLTGLPPTPEEIAAFENDPSPEAFATVVDRLLDSPHHGEQMGRRWLDVVRYADTAGENSDHPLPHAWRYRNWIIQAFNADKPYDEFLRDQIAGDLIGRDGPPENYADRVVATGYLAIARRFGHDIDQDMHLTYEDVIDTLGKSVMGLTLGCARCHDHKYDPITARDYYGLYGVFQSTRFAFPGCEPKQLPRDLVPLIPPQDFEHTYQPRQQELASLETQIKQLTEAFTAKSRVAKDDIPDSRVLSAGTIEDGTGRELALDEAFSGGVAVKKGNVLVLAIDPRGDYGADTTQVEWTLSESSGGRRWSVTDLLPDFHSANPRTLSGATWCYLDGRNGWSFLPRDPGTNVNRPELRVWSSNGTPSVFVNPTDQPVQAWTKLAARSFFVHPAPDGPVAVAWVAPDDLTLQITARISDAHPGGNGVDWKLEHFADSQLGERLIAAGAESAALAAAEARRSELAAFLTYPVAYAVQDGESHHARLHKRGEPTDLGDEVPRKFLDVLGGDLLATAEGSGRLELANRLTAPSNPLTPRVIVNRVWQWHFGRGLVATPNDFGLRGAAPSHPELLDHLAATFIAEGWSLKKLHRRIMLSAVYQLASADDQPPAPSDLYTTFPRRRLNAEELRDALLAVSEELDRTPGEAHPFPPESTWAFTQHGPFAAEYPSSKRSVYLMQKRNRRDRFFALFDGADPNASTPVRDVTTVPTQALYFLNDPFVHERAAQFANRLVEQFPDPRARLDAALQRLFSRPANDTDHADFLAFRQELSAETSLSDADLWQTYARLLMSSNEFLYID